MSASVPVCVTVSAFEDDDAVGERIRIERIVGDEDADTVEAGEMLAEITAHARAGRRRRERRAVRRATAASGGRQRAGQRDALLLSARQRRGTVPRVIGEAERVRATPSPASRASCRRHPPGPQPEGDVVERVEVREQQVVLEHHADRPVLRRRRTCRWPGRRGPCRRARCDRRRSAAGRRGNAAGWSCRRRSGRGPRRLRPACLEVDVERRARRGAADGGVRDPWTSCVSRRAADDRPPSQRSRNAINTANETAMRTQAR